MKKYLPYFLLVPLANGVWAFRSLPQINEQGNASQVLYWFLVQLLLPILFAALLPFRKKYIFLAVGAYGIFLLLNGVGILGWGLLGVGTPLSIYAVGAILCVAGFAILYRSMDDMGLGKKRRHHGFDNE